MPLAAGARLGPYEILGPLGQGGMGEVYQARDTRLDRTVAIKVLPADLAADAQFHERFEREARVISSLSHPHICPLFDVGSHDGTEFLVMEHLEGETLAARLEKGQVPFAQALTIAIEIASALDTAHRAGIVHRDLKPANIFLTRNGAKLLDFGLAKNSPRPAIGSSAVRSMAGVPTALPTTPPAHTITAQGTILGTFQYMAPEQLEGHEADARSDIFAFGCVLFEMVTGRKAFQGRTQVSLIGAILKDDPPPVSTVQALSPAMFDFVVRRCLAKDPDRRWQTAADLLGQLEWIAQGDNASAVPMSTHAPVGRRGVLVAVGAAVVAAIVAGAAAWLLKPTPAPPATITRFQIPLPPDESFSRTGRHFVAVSPDGTKVVYVANQQLNLRPMDQLEATAIRGTNLDPSEPFFSPDGQWIGFWASNQLRKIAITGGAPVKICDAGNPWGATWTGDRILLGQGGQGIMEVPANGGTPRTIVSVDGSSGELAHGPHLLPDGDSLLFTLAKGQQWDTARAVVQSLKTGRRTVLLEGATDARYVETGHIVYGHDNTILAAPFDVRRLAMTGGPVALVEGVTQAQASGALQFALSRSGSAVLVSGNANASRTLTWMDRHGTPTAIVAAPRAFVVPRVSPDGTRAAMEISDADTAIWIWEFARGTLTRLTFGRNIDRQPRWTPDGRRVLYSSNVDGDRGVFVKAADGTGAAERLTKGGTARQPRSVSPDGKWLLVAGGSAKTQGDLSLVGLEGDHTPRPLLQSEATENNGEISPDGRWLAYTSDESSRLEVYVRPFPDVDKGRWQISTEGGTLPRWSRDGRELLYIALTSASMMSVAVRFDNATLAAAPPTKLFSMTGYLVGYDVAPDGRFLLVKDGVANQQQQVTVVEHWIEELKNRVGAK